MSLWPRNECLPFRADSRSNVIKGKYLHLVASLRKKDGQSKHNRIPWTSSYPLELSFVKLNKSRERPTGISDFQCEGRVAMFIYGVWVGDQQAHQKVDSCSFLIAKHWIVIAATKNEWTIGRPQNSLRCWQHQKRRSILFEYLLVEIFLAKWVAPCNAPA